MVGADSVDAFRVEFAASVILQLSRSNRVATCTVAILFERITRGRARKRRVQAERICGNGGFDALQTSFVWINDGLMTARTGI